MSVEIVDDCEEGCEDDCEDGAGEDVKEHAGRAARKMSVVKRMFGSVLVFINHFLS
jgi:hypothetical protein